MKRLCVLFLTSLIIASCSFFESSQINPLDHSPYGYDGYIKVEPIELTGNELYGSKIFGNSEGTYYLNNSRSTKEVNTDETVLFIPDELKRYPDINFVEKKSYDFKSFKLNADIFFLNDYEYYSQDFLMRWGGDASDLSTYIDLVTGEIITDDLDSLYQDVYTTVMIQLNAPAETIVPDFGDEESYDQTTFSWTEVKPFFSTNSSAQHIVLSTYIDQPFVQWAGGKPDNWDSLESVIKFKELYGDFDSMESFGDWLWGGVLNEEFFTEIAKMEYQEDPYSGEGVLFLPLYEPIDLRGMEHVTFSIEFFMKDLFEVRTDDVGNNYYMLSASKNYVTDAGEVFYAPLPIRISYVENENGFTVNPK